MNKINMKLKVFLIAVLVVLVAGMTMLGVLGFNQTIDDRQSFEMKVTINQNVEEGVEALKSSSQKALSDLGLSPVSSQELNDGATLVYKFNQDVSDKVATVKTAVDTALSSTQISGLEAEVKVYQNFGKPNEQIGNMLISLGLAVAVIFVFAFIMTKFSGGVSVFASSILSLLVFLALVALTRIPAQPYLALMAGITMALTAALSVALTTRYTALAKANDKSNVKDIAEKVSKSFKSVFVILAALIAIVAVITAVIGLPTSLYLGLLILVAGVCSISCAYFTVPFVWALVKGKKK